MHLRPRTSILLCDRAKLRSNPCLSKRKKRPRSSGTRVDQIARVVFHCRSIRSRLVDRRFATYLSNAFRRDRYSWRTGVRRDRGTDYAVDQARVRAEFRGLDATSIDRTRQRGLNGGWISKREANRWTYRGGERFLIEGGFFEWFLGRGWKDDELYRSYLDEIWFEI